MSINSLHIRGTGRYAPEKIATNEDFASFLDTSDEWITTRTGIARRHVVTWEPIWMMGAEASKQAMAAADCKPEDIGMVICTTVGGDFYTPSTACIIQAQLGIPDSLSLDINVACAAYCTGMDMARRYLSTGDVDNVLVVAAEAITQFANYEDRSSCILFGDGAGACVVTRKDGLYGSIQGCDATGVGHILYKKTRKTNPFNSFTGSFENDPYPVEHEKGMIMNGREVYKFATRVMPEIIRKACERAGITVDELDLIFPHQANLRIIETAGKNLGIDPGKIYVNIQEYGNSSSATIPIGLDECVRSGRLKRGDKICMVGFGAGLTYGAVVMEY